MSGIPAKRIWWLSWWKDFNGSNPEGMELESRSFTEPEAFENAVETVLLAGEVPAMVLAEPYQYLGWQETGAVIDLTPYLASPAYGKDLSEVWPALAARDQVGGQRLAYPGLFTAQVLLYNQSWAEELGFESPPMTAEAFARQACAAHQKNGDRTGGWMIDRSARAARQPGC